MRSAQLNVGRGFAKPGVQRPCMRKRSAYRWRCSAFEDREDQLALRQELFEVRRRLDVAVKDEDFALAAFLRDEGRRIEEQLPPIQQYIWHQLEKARVGDKEEKIQAIQAVGNAGGDDVIAELAVYLNNPNKEVQEATEKSMWCIFMRSSNTEVNSLMEEGTRHLTSSGEMDAALKTFTQIISIEPSYAEGYNKRATVFYLMDQLESSIDDCKTTLKLQPFHFGALSGMGLCYLKMKRYEDALEAFERCLQIHPGLTQVRRYVEALRQELTKSD